MQDRADCSTTEAASAVRKGLREFTANLFRVVRGAGRPDLIAAQASALAQIIEVYREICGEGLRPEDFGEALRLDPVADDEGEAWPDWDRAVREMVNGALQVAAAELLAQPAQAASGRRELFLGYRRIEKLHRKQVRRLLRRRPRESDA